MRVILSELKLKEGQQELEFELIDTDILLNNVSITFIEKESMASITMPVSQKDIKNDLIKLKIDAKKFHFENSEQNEFEWIMYFNFGDINNLNIVQVESEYLSNNKRLSLTDYYQISSNANGMATLKVKTKRSNEEFMIDSINLTLDGQLKITGYNQIDNKMLYDQKIILKNNVNSKLLEYPIEKNIFKGIFEIIIPLDKLERNANYNLFINYLFEEEEVEQKLILSQSLSGHLSSVNLKNGRQVAIDKTISNGIRLSEFAQLSLPQKVALVPEKVENQQKKIQAIFEKLNRFRLRKLFGMGHSAYEEPTIIFESFGGRQVSDSPYAIYQLFKNLYPGFNFIWSIDRSLKSFCKQNGIRYVIRNTSKWVKVIEKSQFWISNARFPAWVKKPSYVTYIQTWHGTPLKKLGLDIDNVSMPGTSTNKYHNNFVKEANRWDALVSPNDYSTQIFRSAFGFKNQILKIGYPRNDELINHNNRDYINNLKEELNIPKDKKVVLYAPTYRDNQFESKGKYTFELPFSLDDFKNKFGEDAVLILRMHYLISNALDISDYSDFVYDYSNYSNISDLYLVSDVLVTDYSSVFFDYAYLKRPIIFYPYDYHVYKDDLRGFYLNYENDLPGDIVHNEKDLMTSLELSMNNNVKENKQFMDFYNRFCAIDEGLSSQKVVDYVIQQIEK
ncbi:CDP-glycerol glycerophosphotransferase family protein [Lactobacillus sp. S2-2]|uniref:CDP-glycerol glycerophosphotransferase family protein n=1 Tax=Lactobacillus sp. S2-2 TaxID=2692917 RepID=UPI001F319F16|nr:CDP-glycerol glycerophosphotransferase family protein [Lactobacillus sp. S2-2]MCF6514827.1 CDP-glycerol glycerophosphotransferase family protein [Lactobacillus sp. S2-2]